MMKTVSADKPTSNYMQGKAHHLNLQEQLLSYAVRLHTQATAVRHNETEFRCYYHKPVSLKKHPGIH
jgi:hypothetical protein